MPTETRIRARHERERERHPATEPGEIPGQLDIDDQDQEDATDG